MEDLGAIVSLTEVWFSNLKQFKEENLIRSIVIGICSLLNSDLSKLPEAFTLKTEQLISSEKVTKL